MASLYLLIPVAILFIGVSITLFIWAVKNRQFEDLDREGERILFEQREVPTDSPNSAATIAPPNLSTHTTPATTSNTCSIDHMSTDKRVGDATIPLESKATSGNSND